MKVDFLFGCDLYILARDNRISKWIQNQEANSIKKKYTKQYYYKVIQHSYILINLYFNFQQLPTFLFSSSVAIIIFRYWDSPFTNWNSHNREIPITV